MKNFENRLVIIIILKYNEGNAKKVNKSKHRGEHMRKFILSTDSSCDLPEYLIKENDINLINLSVTLAGVTYDGDKSVIDPKEFYESVRGGEMPVTSQINPDAAAKFFEKLMATGNDVLHIAFSSALSGTYSSMVIAADELNSKSKDKKIVVIDSKCASLGQGLLVHYAIEAANKGMSLDEAVSYIEELKLKICHLFTVDNLFHLHRGGRVSRASAIFGTMLSVKPILHVDDEGRLVPIAKIRGRKQSLVTLVDNMAEQMGSNKNDVVFISHGDCIEDATLVKELIEERFLIEAFLINYVGPVIGAHSGPGTIALFFVGDKR